MIVPERSRPNSRRSFQQALDAEHTRLYEEKQAARKAAKEAKAAAAAEKKKQRALKAQAKKKALVLRRPAAALVGIAINDGLIGSVDDEGGAAPDYWQHSC